MNLLLVICSLAVGHSIFWAAVLFSLNSKLSNRLLAVLLIMLAFRVGKSVTGFVFPGHMFLFSTMGLVSMAEIGPCLLLFTQSFFDSSFKLKLKHFLHFVPGVLSLILVLASEWRGYYLFTAHVLIYLLITAFYLFRNNTEFKADDIKWKWIIYLISGIALLWITFVLQLIFYHPLVYRLIVITAAVVFYALSWWAIQRSKIFLPESHKKKEESGDSYTELGKRISTLFEEGIFIDPNLTVTRLASQLKSPPYLVSKAINHCFEKSFSELLTQYRIKKSEQLLLADRNKLLTIEAIAYESGFNTLSAFYTAFKKMNKVTPAQFRDSHHRSNMRIA